MAEGRKEGRGGGRTGGRREGRQEGREAGRRDVWVGLREREALASAVSAPAVRLGVPMESDVTAPSRERTERQRAELGNYHRSDSDARFKYNDTTHEPTPRWSLHRAACTHTGHSAHTPAGSICISPDRRRQTAENAVSYDTTSLYSIHVCRLSHLGSMVHNWTRRGR